MCYSKEVQLATGSTILGFCLFYYIYFSLKYQAQTKKWLLPFLKNVIIAYALVGGHQVFEFLTLITNSQVIYKIGLVISVSSMYFFIRSLEIILNRNLKSGIALCLIGAVAINALFVDMSFAPYKFFIKHNTAWLWAFSWMLLFIYFHICAFAGRKYLKDETSKRAILTYLIATIDLSFILSVIYTYYGYLKFSSSVCTAMPSIWCTFSVVQIFILPIFLSLVPKVLERPEEETIQTIKETIIYLVLAFVIIIFLTTELPFFKCLSLKYVFP